MDKLKMKEPEYTFDIDKTIRKLIWTMTIGATLTVVVVVGLSKLGGF
ncbi:MAG: hypothetical protein RPR40_12280 [Bermanella sp.]